MTEPICEINHCTGCGACAGICPTSSITLLPEIHSGGQIYPKINQNTCVDCGACVKTCPANYPVQLIDSRSAIASYDPDDVKSKMSSSGGLAFAISEQVIRNGGVVYGSVVVYGDNFEIRHERISKLENLKRTQGSKYVHSHIHPDIYKSIKADVKDGKIVVFIGTGCQVAGVKNYLKKDYQNLLLIDIICHGVPSQMILRDYLKEAGYNPKDIKLLTFRTKTNFGVYGVYGVYGEKIFRPLRKCSYIQGFMKGLFYRDSCYTCKYATSKRCSDITLGDFWGLKKSIDRPERKDKGTSLVMINTSKGEGSFKNIAEKLIWEERPLSEAIAGNHQLQFPSPKHYANGMFKFLYPICGYRITSTLSLIREKVFYDFALPAYYKYLEPLIQRNKKR